MMNKKELRNLQKEWYKKLSDSGFTDLEDSYGNLYKPDTRTIAWQNQERIRDFYLNLDSFLSNNKIPELHEKILTQWSDGVYLIDIAKSINRSLSYVKTITNKYKQLILIQEKNESI